MATPALARTTTLAALLAGAFLATPAHALPPEALDLNRTGAQLSLAELPSRAAYGFKWQADDADTLCWMPQGITGFEADNGTPFLVVSWHNDPVGRTDVLCGDQKGSRVSFIDHTDESAPQYRHVLLLDENFEVLHGHAGGVSYHAGKLHVANTHRVDIYDVASIIEVTQPDDYFSYRYVLQRESSYPVDDNASFISYDQSNDLFLTGHFTNSSDPAQHRLFWYSPLAIQPGQPTQGNALPGLFDQMQGAAATGDLLWVSQSYGYFDSRVSVARYQPDVTPPFQFQTLYLPPGLEDLYFSESDSRLWSLTEFSSLQALAVALYDGQTPSGEDQRIVIALDTRTTVPNETLGTVTDDAPSQTAVDSDVFGNHIVAWTSGTGDGTTGLFVSAYTPTGEPYFTEKRVGSLAANVTSAEVAINHLGELAVVWEEEGESGGASVHLVGLDIWGNQRFAPLALDATGGEQRAPDVATDFSGNLIVVWEDVDAAGGTPQIAARGFTSDGNERFGKRLLNAQTSGQHLNPAISLDEIGQIAVVWQDDSDGNGRYNIHLQRLDLQGEPLGEEQVVHETLAGDQVDPAVDVGVFGHHIIAWTDDADNNGTNNIAARMFDYLGTPVGPEFRVNARVAGEQRNPAVAIDFFGRSLISWEDDTDDNGFYEIRAVHTDHAGQVIGSEYTANIVSEGIQRQPAVGLGVVGKSLVVWDNGTEVRSSRVRYLE